MALVAHGTKITEFSEKTGPKGKALQGEGETGLASHHEATLAVKDRVGHTKAVGFEDTPEVKAAFESLKEERDPEVDRMEEERARALKQPVGDDAAPRGAEKPGGADDGADEPTSESAEPPTLKPTPPAASKKKAAADKGDK